MKRPPGVTVLAVLSLLGAAFLLFGALSRNSVQGWAATAGGTGDDLARLGPAGTALLLIFAALYLAIGVGLLKLMNWARVLMMILLVIGVAETGFGIVTSFAPLRAVPLVVQLIGLAFNIGFFLYLRDLDIKQAFMPASPA